MIFLAQKFVLSKIIQEFSLAHGPFWFFDTSLADDEHKFIENMNSIDRELQRSKEDFIKEHRRNYDKPIFPPVWKTLELASFGTLSKLYYNFGGKKLRMPLYVAHGLTLMVLMRTKYMLLPVVLHIGLILWDMEWTSRMSSNPYSFLIHR